MKKHYYVVIDTETANSLTDPLVYDVGLAVIDRQGNVYETHSFVVRDIYSYMPDIMQTAYYAKKLPRYQKDIKSGTRTIVSLFEVRRTILDICKRYNIRAFMAHNARFDVLSLNTTMRYITKSKYRYFFPYGYEIWDTLMMARSTIGKQKKYKKFCTENGYLCKNGTVRLTAEILYRYITNDIDFSESHTGLEDVLIEKEIFVKCVNQKKKMKRCLYGKKA